MRTGRHWRADGTVHAMKSATEPRAEYALCGQGCSLIGENEKVTCKRCLAHPHYPRSLDTHPVS